MVPANIVTISSNRHRFDFPSSSDEIFGIIASADRYSYIQQAARFLDQHVVQFVRSEVPFPFKAEDFAGVNSNTALLPAIRLLEQSEEMDDDEEAVGSMDIDE